jgi:hypothetical protein
MTDEPRRGLDSRVSVLEAEFRNMGRRMDAHLVDSTVVHDRLATLIDRLDARADGQDLKIGRIGGAIALAVFLATLAAPVIVRVLGL